MCHALDKVLQLAMATFPKSGNFAAKLERLLEQTNQIKGKINVRHNAKVVAI